MNQQLSLEWYDIVQDPHGWDGHVAEVGQNLFHRNAMLEAHQSAKSFRRGILLRRAGEAVGVVGGLLQPRHTGGRFSALSFPQPRHLLDPELPHALTQWLLRQGMTRIDFGSFDGGVEGYQGEIVGRMVERLEFLYDLTESEETRLRRACTNHRRKLKKSEREPMHLQRIEAGQALLMTRLSHSWARRRGERYSLRRLWQIFAFYRRLTGHVGSDGSGGLYGLYDQRGRILSMAYMLERGGSAFYMIGASSAEGYEKGAAVRLFWELARHYPRVGIHTLNFGGVPAAAREEGHAEHGVYRFKLGFGIEPTVRRSLTVEG